MNNSLFILFTIIFIIYTIILLTAIIKINHLTSIIEENKYLNLKVINHCAEVINDCAEVINFNKSNIQDNYELKKLLKHLIKND